MDIVFRNASVIDGTGAPSFAGDVTVRGDRITEVRGRSRRKAASAQPTAASAPASGAPMEIDCSGLFLAPGFIDIHSHSDIAIFENQSAANYVTQGVTLLVSGNCGFSGAPISLDHPEIDDFLPDPAMRGLVTWSTFGEYLAVLDRLPKGINVAGLAGHGNVRGAVLGFADRPAVPGDLEKMKAILGEALEAGAFGLSTGLIYAPGVFARTEELVELARLVASYGGLYATHIRNESDMLVEAVLEAIRIGREAGVRVEISHHKASGRRNWGLTRTTLDLMEYYRRFGVEVTCDLYPCTASATGLYSLFPAWFRARGKREFARLIDDPASRARLRAELAHPSMTWENVFLDAGYDAIAVSSSAVFPQHLGRSVAEIARTAGKDGATQDMGRAPTAQDPLDTVFDLVRADPDMGVIAGGMDEADVRHVLGHRLSLVGSDGSVTKLGSGCPHPRGYRAFTRVLETYAREEKVLGLEEAVRKMTGMPAWKLGLPDRGLLRPGAKADLAVFDLWGLRARAEYGDPHHYSEGMVYVLVNGDFVIRDGRLTGNTPGEVVRRP